MADDEYNRKLESLQQYIPFLNNMIVQLKDPRKKNREQQLTKMVSLHSMITDKKKKLKLETLIKCEDVILKLYDKVKSGSQSQAPVPRSSPAGLSKYSPITPSSPSPPRDLPKTKPVVIPTEKIIDRESKLGQPSSTYKPKIDIYSSAADSLKSSSQPKPSVFERLGKRAPDMSKPPISLKDLEALQDDNVDTEGMSLNELTDLREKLQKQLKTSDEVKEPPQSGNDSINTTIRNTTILTKKAVDKAVLPESKTKSSEHKSVSKSVSVPKPVKVIKEASNMFGSTLSSIDNQILESTKHKERRSSTGSKKDSNESGDKSKESKSTKEEKKSESSSIKSLKDKTDRKSSGSEHKTKEKEVERRPSFDKKKDEKKEEDERRLSDKKKEEKKAKDESKDRKSKGDKPHEPKTASRDEKARTEEPKATEEKVKNDKPKTETIKPIEPAPVYKRLADKYNPKPRKQISESTTDVPKKVAECIENSMKTTALSIPFLEQKSTIKTLPSLNIPLPSPTSSTNSADNEIASYNRKPLLPSPQPMQTAPIPTHMSNPTPQSISHHVSNIVSNPNMSGVVNNIVNQFKGRQTPLPNQYPPTQPQFPSNPPRHQFPQQFSPNPPRHQFTPGPSQQPHFAPRNQQHPPIQPQFPPNNFQQNEMGYNQNQQNYWPNQAPNKSSYPQRSFTPLPNQFDNQMQQMDYYPPGSTPTHSYNRQGPPMLSPQATRPQPLLSPQSIRHRPPEDIHSVRPRPSEDIHSGRPYPSEDIHSGRSYPSEDFHSSRNREDWRRPRSREPYRSESSRDPRLYRDHRNSYRDDPRYIPRRDSRESERDPRSSRDPRLNRYRQDRYEREPHRSRSRSRSRESDDGKTFTSPLNSLYGAHDGYKNTGKGYGVQNFKIPKIKKEEDFEEKEVKGDEIIEERELKSPEIEEPKAGPSTEAPHAKEVTQVENMTTTNVSSSSETSDNKISESPVEEKVAVGEISSTNDIQEGQTKDEPKLEDEGQTDIINKFLKKLLENERTRAAASMFIDNVSSSLDDEKLKMVVQTVKRATEKPVIKRQILKKRMKVKSAVLSAKLIKKKQLLRKKMQLKKQKRARVIRDDDDDDDDDEEKEKVEKKEEKEEDEVLVTVGERIKSRKRQASLGSQTRKKARHKTELDLLHEDIQDMFIRDGVLTATGKRMCRLLKNDNENKPTPLAESPRSTRRTRNSSEKFDSKSNSDKLKAMSNVRVLLPKIPVDKLSEIDDDSQRYSLRRSNKTVKSYAEADSDEEKEKRLNKEKEKEREREKEREKEKEKEKKIDKQEQLEEEKELQKQKLVETPKKVRNKRAKAWASGVILKQKRKRTAVEEEKDDVEVEEEETDKLTDFIEPDKNYFSAKSWQSKASCKLCSYNGRDIAKHYRMRHPDSEVLSARLRPDKAERAIKASRELKLDEKEDQKVPSTRRVGFKCRFCDLEMHSKPTNFFDHITTHTGEYRYRCHLCPFVACNSKQFKLHSARLHPKVTSGYPKVDWIKTRIYGYICLECNYVQTNRKTVENHVNVYHLGEGKKILKIHLSPLDDTFDRRKKPKKVTPQVEPEEEMVDKEEEEEKEIDANDESEEKNEETEVEMEKTEETKKEKKVEVEEPPAKKRKTPVREFPLPQPVIKKEKEIDMTVFTCNTDIQEENEKIEQERLKKMAELNETVKTSRQSLNFVDQLSNRLLQEEKESPLPEIVSVKTEPMETEVEPEPELELESLPELEPVSEPQRDPLEIVPKKPMKVIEPPVSTSVEVVQKDNTIIQGMIQKLQGILKDGGNTAKPPPLAPLVGKPNDDVISAGFLNISKEADSLEYICRVPSCLFTTKNRNSFVTHWEEDHTRINQSYKATKCKICQMEVKASADTTLLSRFFSHVENEHLEQGTKKEEKEERDTATPILRTRRLSGDKLSATKEEVDIKNVKKEELKEEDEAKEEDNPFPFKISGVMSLAEQGVPPLSPIREKANPKIESVILKEVKMTAIEKEIPWKCIDAMKKFLQLPRSLYKCPQYFCKFATSLRPMFDSHIKIHSPGNDQLVCCVYCDIKTPLTQASLHIDLRHSNCLYSCSECLYRALLREYVAIHLKLRHKESDYIISLSPKQAKTIMMSKQKKCTVKEACPSYKCGYLECRREFLFINEFCNHIALWHKGTMTCGYETNGQRCGYKSSSVEMIIDHYRSHNCYPLHCLLCKAGCVELSSMLEHYSSIHPNMEPDVVDRRNSPKTPRTFSYNYTSEAFSKVKHVPVNEILSTVNANKYSVKSIDNQVETMTKSTTPEPKNVALVPLSLIQPNPTDTSKKIIAIIPKSMEPLQILTQISNTEDTTSTPSPSFVFASTPTPDKDDPPKDDPVRVEEDGDNSTDANSDPLCIENESGGSVLASGDESDSQDVNEVSDMKSFGLIGYQLYRCAFCDISFSNARDFKMHCLHSKLCRDHSNPIKPFKCVHCERLFKNPHGILEHIQYHGQLRFCCSLCVKRFPSSFSLKFHMRCKHSVTNTITTPLVPHKIDLERDEFVLRPVPVVESEIKEVQSSKFDEAQKNVYGPDEIDQLPKRCIFSSEVKCAQCSYSTKVRSNLVRHLQFHTAEKSVPETSPVNPVPCLEKNEKMFDKMTNLAISSFTGASSRMGPKIETKVEKEQLEVPAYVPSHRRYVCCADGCNYLCLEEANLRHHLFALHVQEPSFTCAHCKTNLKTDIEGFLKHLKLHDLHLYKCSQCSFVHNLRHKVDKHSTDKHPDQNTTTITVRALEGEVVDLDQLTSSSNVGVVSEPTPPNVKWTKPWHCGMCKYRCAAKNDIVSHIFNKHDINAQFKCTLCSYKTDEKQTFGEHFKDNHPDNEIDIIYVYYKSEPNGQGTSSSGQKQFDTTPLWQRDRPRVRHIRGILFEETSTQKKKSTVSRPLVISTPSTSSSTTSNLDLAIEAVARGLDECSAIKVDEAKEAVPLKETGDDSVILIEDDDDDNEPQVEQSGDSELLIDVDVTDDNREVKVEKEYLSQETLITKYGKLCTPTNKTFRCPLCIKFRTKKITFFLYHLLAELKCFRFRCNGCDFSSVTFDSMLTHCQDTHEDSAAENITHTYLEKSLEYWLQMVIRHQAEILVQASPPAKGEKETSNSHKYQCQYCHRWFKTIHTLKDHELCHWADHTYSCNHCFSEQPTLEDMFQHSLLVHPDFQCEFAINGPNVAIVIRTLKSPPPQPGPQLSGSTSGEDVVYECYHCSEVEKTPEAIKKHVSDVHEGSDCLYKIVTRAKLEVMYCCTYCHERGSDRVLKEHHNEKHGGLKFSIYQYICLECSETYLNIKDLRKHFSESHLGKKLTYSCVESKQSGSKDQYCCTKCPFRSGSVGGIRSHLRKHLRPIDCLLCGATFIYPTEGRAHHNKEHMHNTERVEENKDRIKEYEELVKQIVAAKQKGNKTPPVKKMLARKSTGAPFVREYSYYGAKKQETDLKNITTTIEVNKVTTRISAEQFSNIFNIFPVVEVRDCQNKGS